MDDQSNPVIINPSPVPDQIGTATRDAMLVISAIPALIAVIGTRDVKQIVDYVGSSEFAPVLAAIITAVVVVWRQFKARSNKARMVAIASAAPDSVAVVEQN